jgi:hypothetical protein
MTPLSEFKRVWQESSAESMVGVIGEEEVRMLLNKRSASVKKQIMKRLTAEIMTYFLIALSILCISLVGGSKAGRTFLPEAVALLVLVPSIAVLAYKEYRLRTSPMSSTLRDSISDLIEAIDSTARLYLSAYVASIFISLVLLEILLISSKGWTVITILSILAGLAFGVWSYLSGRRYASGMFRRYRSELVSLLGELESQ